MSDETKRAKEIDDAVRRLTPSAAQMLRKRRITAKNLILF
jgi:hypothetical protein